jgi:hypothetical protein
MDGDPRSGDEAASDVRSDEVKIGRDCNRSHEAA